MAARADLKMAYDAGRVAFTSEPPERRTVDACPFELGTEERGAWLRGFSEALDAEPHVPTLKQDVEDALELADKAGS